MPFSKYFQDDLPPADGHAASALQFQLPAFIQPGPPTLAPGGGAEVLTFNPAWFANPGTAYCPPYAAHFRDPPALTRPRLPVCAPSPLGLPVYSASGFDVLSILARVAARPNARIVLGPVDLTCSFVVVDVRRHDQPIVYCSPTFCRLTGYPEHEVLGRNCRFLQAPPSSGPVRAGESRRFTSQASVDTMRKALIANKEVQTSIVNFRKDGSAFINLVSVVPVLGGERAAPHELNDVVYHVGFQIDLTEQPNAILDKLRDGSYTQNTLPLGPAAPYTESHHDIPPPPPQRKQQLPPILMAPSLAQALANPALHRDLPITTSTTAPSPLPPASTASAASAVPGTAINNPLSLILLEYAPDFILVVSLKGAFLYVAPAIFHVLGHSPAALVGRSISDLAHPEDVVPLERQLKESSTLVNVAVPSSPGSHNELSHHSHHHQHAKLIDVLFRARTAGGSYVWVEARGRLHVEPGKGRKAIVLSARARRMPRVRWGDLLPPLRPSADGADTIRECWAQLSGLGKAAGAIVSVGNGVESVFACRASEILGRRISMLVVEEDRESVEGVLREIEGRGDARVVLFVRLRTGTEGEVVRVRLAFYPSYADGEDNEDLCIAPPIVLLHVARGEGIDNLSIVEEQQHLHDPEENVFAELDVRRGSSWQYELQQLRFRNMRLREEVKALEKEVKAYEGREGTPCGDVVEALTNEGNPTTITGNSYPPPQYASSDINVGASRADQDAYRYDAQPETEQHVNYTTALERYAADGGAGYEGLEMALGMGMGIGMDVGLGGMGMDASTASAYGLAQNHPEHRSSFHVSHGHHQHTQHSQHGRLTGQAHMQTQTQAQSQTQAQAQAQTQGGMYAPQPIHSHAHSPSGLLHALGAPSHHHNHSHQHQHQHRQQHQEIQRPGGAHVNRVRAYDSRSQGLAHHPPSVRGDEDLGRRRREAQWGSGAMHPGIKRSYGR